MASTYKKVRTHYSTTIEAGDDKIIEFFDDISNVVLTIGFPNGASNINVQSSTDETDTLKGIGGAVVIWEDWPYGTITAQRQASMIAPNAIKIDNDLGGSNAIHISLRGNYSN